MHNHLHFKHSIHPTLHKYHINNTATTTTDYFDFYLNTKTNNFAALTNTDANTNTGLHTFSLSMDKSRWSTCCRWNKYIIILFYTDYMSHSIHWQSASIGEQLSLKLRVFLCGVILHNPLCLLFLILIQGYYTNRRCGDIHYTHSSDSVCIVTLIWQHKDI